MIDDANAINIAFHPPDPERVYAHYLATCRRAGITPVSREQAHSLMQEWNEVLSSRPEPTTH